MTTGLEFEQPSAIGGPTAKAELTAFHDMKWVECGEYMLVAWDVELTSEGNPTFGSIGVVLTSEWKRMQDEGKIEMSSKTWPISRLVQKNVKAELPGHPTMEYYDDIIRLMQLNTELQPHGIRILNIVIEGK